MVKTARRKAGGFLLPRAPGDQEYLGFDLDVSGVTNAELLNNVRLFRIDGGDDPYGEGEVHGGLAEIQFDGSAPDTTASTPLQLLVTPGESAFDMSWESTEGSLYDLVSSTDLSTPVSQWAVYESNSGIAATAPLNTLTGVNSPDTKRFFALIEQSGN